MICYKLYLKKKSEILYFILIKALLFLLGYLKHVVYFKVLSLADYVLRSDVITYFHQI